MPRASGVCRSDENDPQPTSDERPLADRLQDMPADCPLLIRYPAIRPLLAGGPECNLHGPCGSVRSRQVYREDKIMRQRRLIIAGFATAAILAVPTTGGTQVIVSGNDEKVVWNDAGQAVFLPPGKDTVSFIDITERESPKILTSIVLENSIFGPPTNAAVSPKGEIAPVANSVTQTKDGEK